MRQRSEQELRVSRRLHGIPEPDPIMDRNTGPEASRAAVLSRIARDYNVAIYEVGHQVSMEAEEDPGWSFEVEVRDVGYHP